MSTQAIVRLWGTDVGYLNLEENQEIADFEYDRDFLRSGIEIAPLSLPLASRVYRFPELPFGSFHGLPGLLADSLPDKFGNAIIDIWLATMGRKPETFNAVERLCYIGTRGMGALEFKPAKPLGRPSKTQIHVGRLVELASEILSHRSSLSTVFADRKKDQAVREILRVGTSAGGARAKALIAWNPQTNEVRSGQVTADPGYEYWLMKFDGVKSNRDKELADPEGFGAIEYAYYSMAKDAGISMTPCRLFEENGRRHFMTKRFDRTDKGAKLHMQSLAALAHFDFNMAGAYGYEQAIMAIQELKLGPDAIEQQFRRMVFNIVARNQDDHVKNIAFLMDRQGHWSLSPAFDVTYSYNPAGDWTSAHQMTLNQKRDNFAMRDFESCGQLARLKQGEAKSMLTDIQTVVSKWRDYADEAGVRPDQRDEIHGNLRLDSF
ncbi:type II toxin-antitoxin system HipA family toxin [Verrucomicrobiaceae bacterium N1E253]|uniref:Type II toxin-antitoxin system HipA family toxin n=1 Tax=Oceaniferula marina TaxID=2748318 RepID=A0A851GGJ6_9BACT|nr:type II toxin-antitoxin system HipA family toxin [Oceaniferula marina]NWK56022.1 type II toxin-antitoxin system HipA family toxin [Oceaniferula marina]